jgi:lysine 2,3-aminomutase
VTAHALEPNWRRLPGFRDVSTHDWESARWQRTRSIRTVQALKEVFGPHLSDSLCREIHADQREAAVMPLLVPPQMLNAMDEHDLVADPVRRYMLPARFERERTWPSHPRAGRDSLREAEMWAVEGLVHRYPGKALVEMLSTCPQYCGHCTRMDIVGGDTPGVVKYRFRSVRRDRYELMLEYLRSTESVTDVVISGGDIANVPMPLLEQFVSRVLEIPHVREVRLASKSLIALPQHFLQSDVLSGLERLSRAAKEHDVELALHTHANHAGQVTPLVARASAALRGLGIHDLRNQGVLLRGVNDDAASLLALSAALRDGARITPYYLYMCDMIPNAEHWRTPLWQAQELQHSIMGHLPGFATPRIVCDVPGLGKLWVHQVDEYDRERGISYWRKSYRTPFEGHDAEAAERRHEYYDPIHTLPEAGRAWWAEREQRAQAPADLASPV